MELIATIIQPDDFHVHLREGEILKDTVFYSSKYGKVVVMPNLKTPITNIKRAEEYKNQILKYNFTFSPLMTLYLNSLLKKEELKEIPNHHWLLGIKLYPSGATTHSEEGVKVSEIEKFYSYFELMEKYNIPLMVHGEVPDYEIDFFDRERVFIEKYLVPIREKFPSLKITLEHVSSKEGVQFVNCFQNTAATVTPQHLFLTRNDLFYGGINPHHFCLPIVKTIEDRDAIIKEVLNGNPKFFAGTDSAPHPIYKKESCCGPAGVFTAPISIELYIYFFLLHQNKNESYFSIEMINKIENFLARSGSDFYNLEYNQKKLLIYTEELEIPEQYPLGDSFVVPMWSGKKLPIRTEITQNI